MKITEQQVTKLCEAVGAVQKQLATGNVSESLKNGDNEKTEDEVRALVRDTIKDAVVQ